MGSIDDRLNGKKVLVVDDEECMRSLQKRIFDRFIPGYVVHTAENGRIALEMMQHEGYSLVSCDVDMPKMNGLELYSSAKCLDKKPAFLFMTGALTEERKDFFKKEGLIYMPKPFEIQEYVSNAKNLLNGSSA